MNINNLHTVLRLRQVEESSSVDVVLSVAECSISFSALEVRVNFMPVSNGLISFFNPDSIDPLAVVQDDPISIWSDVNSGYDGTQTVLANKPTLNLGVNGQREASFNLTDWLTLGQPDGLDLIPRTDPMTFIFKLGSIKPTQGYIISKRLDSSPNNQWAVWTQDGRWTGSTIGNRSVFKYLASSFPNNSVFVDTVDLVDIYLRVNGSLEHTDFIGTNPSLNADVNIGNSNNGGAGSWGLNGSVTHIAVFDRVLTTQEILDVEAYFSDATINLDTLNISLQVIEALIVPEPILVYGNLIHDGNGSYNASSTPDKAFDGDGNTFYDVLSDSVDTWVGQDYGEEVQIARVEFYVRQNFGTRANNNVRFQYSSDGVNYTDFILLSGYTNGIGWVWYETEDFIGGVPVNGRYFRIFSNAGDGGFCGQPAEIKFFASVLPNANVLIEETTLEYIAQPCNVYNGDKENYLPETKEFLNTQPLIATAREIAINNFVKHIKNNGTFDKWHAMWVFVGASQEPDSFNLQKPFISDKAYKLRYQENSLVHASTGVKSTDISHALTGFVGKDQAEPIQLGLSFYSRDDNNGQYNEIGAFDLSGGNQLRFSLEIKYSGGSTSFDNPNYLLGSRAQATSPNALGLSEGVRESTTVSKLYKNGLQIGANYSTQYESDAMSTEVGLFAFNTDTGVDPNKITRKECAFAGISYARTNAEVLADYKAIQTLQTDLGREVGVPETSFVADTLSLSFQALEVTVDLPTGLQVATILEAEDDVDIVSLSGGTLWILQTNVGGYNGSGFLRINTGDANGTFSLTVGSRLDYVFDIPANGDYYFHVRYFADNSGKDSFHIGFDEVFDATYNGLPSGTGEWEWFTITAPITLTAGIHTLNIWNRELGIGLDQIEVSTNPVPTALQGGGVDISVTPSVSNLNFVAELQTVNANANVTDALTGLVYSVLDVTIQVETPTSRIANGRVDITDTPVNWERLDGVTPSGALWSVATNALSYGGGATWDISALLAEGYDTATANTLFQDENYSSNLTIDYVVPNGNYKVRLFLGEVFFNGAGLRVFDVTINGVLVLDDYDIYAEFGNQVAGFRDFDVTVTNGGFEINFLSSVDNAAIRGIELFSVTDGNTGGDVNATPSFADASFLAELQTVNADANVTDAVTNLSYSVLDATVSVSGNVTVPTATLILGGILRVASVTTSADVNIDLINANLTAQTAVVQTAGNAEVSIETSTSSFVAEEVAVSSDVVVSAGTVSANYTCLDVSVVLDADIALNTLISSFGISEAIVDTTGSTIVSVSELNSAYALLPFNVIAEQIVDVNTTTLISNFVLNESFVSIEASAIIDTIQVTTEVLDVEFYSEANVSIDTLLLDLGINPITVLAEVEGITSEIINGNSYIITELNFKSIVTNEIESLSKIK